MNNTHTSLTVVIISYRKNRQNNRLIFGDPVVRMRRGWRRELVGFQPNQIFAYERWRADKFGTQDWNIYVCKAVTAQQSYTKIPGVLPGSKLLIRAIGKTRAKQTLALFDRLKLSSNGNLNTITEDEWTLLDHDIFTGNNPTFRGQGHV